MGRQALTRETGAVALWTLGQFPCHPRTTVMMPYQAGPEDELGPPVSVAEYASLLHPERTPATETYCRISGRSVLFKANGELMAKVELPARRALGRFASIDPDRGEMRIVQFQHYPQMDYAASFVEPYAGDPYAGGP